MDLSESDASHLRFDSYIDDLAGMIGVTELGSHYATGIQSNVLMWKADAVLPLQGPNRRRPSRPQQRAKQISAKGPALDQLPRRLGK